MFGIPFCLLFWCELWALLNSGIPLSLLDRVWFEAIPGDGPEERTKNEAGYDDDHLRLR